MFRFVNRIPTNTRSVLIHLRYFLINISFPFSMVNLYLDNSPPSGTILNVNVPHCSLRDLKGYRVTIQGKQYFDDNFELPFLSFLTLAINLWTIQ